MIRPLFVGFGLATLLLANVNTLGSDGASVRLAVNVMPFVKAAQAPRIETHTSNAAPRDYSAPRDVARPVLSARNVGWTMDLMRATIAATPSAQHVSCQPLKVEESAWQGELTANNAVLCSETLVAD
jgi:hypothetical protein